MLQHADHVRFGQELLRARARGLVLGFQVVDLDRARPPVIRIVGQIHDAVLRADFLDDQYSDFSGMRSRAALRWAISCSGIHLGRMNLKVATTGPE